METYCCSALAGTHVEAPTLTEVAAPREVGDRIPHIDFILICCACTGSISRIGDRRNPLSSLQRGFVPQIFCGILVFNDFFIYDFEASGNR